MAAMIEKFDQTTESSGGGPSSAAELKRRLVDHLDMLKRPNDLVRVTQVSNRHFRVNTLTPRMSDDSVMPTYHIVKSQFLHVEDRHGELVITDQTRK
jgi:hypothetical protein